MNRPETTVVVAGTGTEVGKTWVSCRLAEALVAGGATVAARKPVLSFDLGDPPGSDDATLLAAATGEAPELVCPPHRRYERAMAPPMAAEVLDRPAFTVAELLAELTWPAGVTADPPALARLSRVGLVESAGGLRSPLAADGDTLTLVDQLDPDGVVLVTDLELGVISSVRLTLGALGGRLPVVVVANRFDAADELHRRTVTWLRERDGYDVVTDVAGAGDGSLQSWLAGLRMAPSAQTET